MLQSNSTIPSPANALPGRTESVPVAKQHYVNGAPLKPPFPADAEQAVFGLGCFWGAERCFWQLDGVL
ncbi:MAG: peptide-methionine (S)-S-oxide reductase, partial [Arenicellales bacterium]|nr:peptide-methionine (S)-S-oxide reductase [Arenicellales bacterium]